MQGTVAVTKIDLSIVVPVYSGEAYLEALVSAVEAVRQAWDDEDAPIRASELIFVDDSAIDGSPALIDRLALEKPWVVSLHLSRNFGQHGATVAGILHSSGDWVVTLDEDLQHPPERIVDLLERAVSKGADVVYARPKSKDIHGGTWRDSSSRNFKRVMEWLTGNQNLRVVNSFRLMRGPIARATASVCSHNTYFDIALGWFTQRVQAVKMDLSDDRYQSTGKSGYNFRSLASHAQRMLFSSQLRFLALGLWLGAFLFVASVIAGLYFFALRLLVPEAIVVQGWSSLFVAICMSSGLLAAMLGLCLQYLSTLVLKAHGRPTFFAIDRSNDADLSAWFGDRAEAAEKVRSA